MVSNEEDVDDRKKTGDSAKDNMHNFIIEVEKKFNKASVTAMTLDCKTKSL